MKEILTSSRISAFQRCQRLHQLRYEQGWQPNRESDEQRFGSLVHAGLEAWWAAAAENGEWTPLKYALDVLAESEADTFERIRAEETLIAYHARWTPTLADYEILAVEQEFRCKLLNPETWRESKRYDLAGKIDLVLKRKSDGAILVTEHKTSSEEIGDGAEYWQRLEMNPQLSTYVLGAESLGYQVAECLYDVIRKPGFRPFKETPDEKKKFKKDGELYSGQHAHDETPEEFRQRFRAELAEKPELYFVRKSIPRMMGEIVAFLRDAWGIADRIAEARKDVAPRSPDACFKYGSRCAFFEHCAHEQDLERSGEFRQGVFHPELTAPKEGAADGHNAVA